MGKYQAFKIGGFFLLIIFVISGMWSVFFYDEFAFANPIFKFVYGGLFSIWDTILALFLGAYLGYSYFKKKTT